MMKFYLKYIVSLAVALSLGLTASSALAFQCNDSVDNDSNGKIDYPADPGCSSATDDLEFTTRDFGGDVKSVGNPSALPNCSPSNAGKKVYYVQGTAVGSCSVAGSAANYCACDGSSYVLLNAESMNLKLNTADALPNTSVVRTDDNNTYFCNEEFYGFAVGERIGTCGLKCTIGTGASCQTGTGSSITVPGQALIGNSTTAGTGAYTSISTSASIGASVHLEAPISSRIEFRIKLNQVPNGTDDFAMRFGWITGTDSTAPTDGAWFSIIRATSATYLNINTAKASATNTVTTATAFDNAWHTYVITCTGGPPLTGCAFTVDGVAVSGSPLTTAANLPTTSSNGTASGISFWNVGAGVGGGRYAYVDRVKWTYNY